MLAVEAATAPRPRNVSIGQIDDVALVGRLTFHGRAVSNTTHKPMATATKSAARSLTSTEEMKRLRIARKPTSTCARASSSAA